MRSPPRSPTSSGSRRLRSSGPVRSRTRRRPPPWSATTSSCCSRRSRHEVWSTRPWRSTSTRTWRLQALSASTCAPPIATSFSPVGAWPGRSETSWSRTSRRTSHLPTLGGPITIVRGWSAVDVKLRGRRVRFLNTHLEASSAPVQVAQANELLAGPANTRLPLILLGDFNSPAEGTGTPTYANLLAAGFADAWSQAEPGVDGLHLLPRVQPAQPASDAQPADRSRAPPGRLWRPQGSPRRRRRICGEARRGRRRRANRSARPVGSVALRPCRRRRQAASEPPARPSVASQAAETGRSAGAA